MLIVRFLHYLGIAMWLGGLIAGIVLIAGSNRRVEEVRAALLDAAGKLVSLIVGPGAIITVGTGVVWSMAITGGGSVEGRVAPLGLLMMSAFGFLGALVALFVTMPAASKLRKLLATAQDLDKSDAFEKLRKRVEIGSYASGVFAILSLFASVLSP